MKFLIILSLVVIFSVYAFAEKDRGGGNVCYTGRKAVLLDTHSSQAPLLPELLGKKSAKIPYSKNISELGVELAYLSEWNDFNIIFFKIIDDLEKNNFKFEATLIKNGYLGIKDLLFVDRVSKKSIRADFTDSSSCNAGNTRAVIYYHPVAGALIDINRWNKLDFKTQAGLIIHEILRNIQIRFSGQGTNLDLQRLTSLLMTGQYSEASSSPFFNYLKKIAEVPSENRFIVDSAGRAHYIDPTGELGNMVASLMNYQLINILASRHNKLSSKEKREIKFKVLNSIEKLEAETP